jgi:hypothetical protein
MYAILIVGKRTKDILEVRHLKGREAFLGKANGELMT